MPCRIRLLPVAKGSAGFHDFDEYERLVGEARNESNAFLILLLGGEAGLRCGEMLALRWEDVISKAASYRFTCQIGVGR
jgi:hypothetical protein